jgi:hypothetical protein
MGEFGMWGVRQDSFGHKARDLRVSAGFSLIEEPESCRLVIASCRLATVSSVSARPGLPNGSALGHWLALDG